MPVEESNAYKQKADEKSVRCDLHLYPNRNHGFFNCLGDKKDFSSTMIKAYLFLKDLGWLSGDPTLGTHPLEPDVK